MCLLYLQIQGQHKNTRTRKNSRGTYNNVQTLPPSLCLPDDKFTFYKIKEAERAHSLKETPLKSVVSSKHPALSKLKYIYDFFLFS